MQFLHKIAIYNDDLCCFFQKIAKKSVRKERGRKSEYADAQETLNPYSGLPPEQNVRMGTGKQ